MIDYYSTNKSFTFVQSEMLCYLPPPAKIAMKNVLNADASL